MRVNLTNNFGLKIISVIFSMLVWLLVVSIADPIATQTYRGVTVETLNAGVIYNEGMVFEVLDSSNVVNITVKANRSILDSMTAEDFKATADMKELTNFNTVPINVTPQKYVTKLKDIATSIKNMQVSIEELESKQFAIIANEPTGTPLDGYAVGDISISPNVIRVSGPASVVSTISKVVVDVDVSDMTSNLNVSAVPKLIDGNGNLIESSSLTLSKSEVIVNVTMLRTKSVGLSFEVEGSPAANYEYTGLKYEPETVEIKGTSSALSAINVIPVPASALKINGAKANKEFVVDIGEYLPEEIQLADNSMGQVAVTALIEKLENRNMELPVNQIEIKNLPENMEISYINAYTVTLTLQGLAAKLDKVKEEQVKMSIDLAGRLPGEFRAAVLIEVPDGTKVIGSIVLDLRLTEQVEQPPEEPGDEPDGGAQDAADDSGTQDGDSAVSGNGQDQTGGGQQDTGNTGSEPDAAADGNAGGNAQNGSIEAQE